MKSEEFEKIPQGPLADEEGDPEEELFGAPEGSYVKNEDDASSEIEVPQGMKKYAADQEKEANTQFELAEKERLTPDGALEEEQKSILERLGEKGKNFRLALALLSAFALMKATTEANAEGFAGSGEETGIEMTEREKSPAEQIQVNVFDALISIHNNISEHQRTQTRSQGDYQKRGNPAFGRHHHCGS